MSKISAIVDDGQLELSVESLLVAGVLLLTGYTQSFPESRHNSHFGQPHFGQPGCIAYAADYIGSIQGPDSSVAVDDVVNGG